MKKLFLSTAILCLEIAGAVNREEVPTSREPLLYSREHMSRLMLCEEAIRDSDIIPESEDHVLATSPLLQYAWELRLGNIFERRRTVLENYRLLLPLRRILSSTELAQLRQVGQYLNDTKIIKPRYLHPDSLCGPMPRTLRHLSFDENFTGDYCSLLSRGRHSRHETCDAWVQRWSGGRGVSRGPAPIEDSVIFIAMTNYLGCMSDFEREMRSYYENIGRAARVQFPDRAYNALVSIYNAPISDFRIRRRATASH